ERNQERVLPYLSVAQKDFARAGKRLRIGCLAPGVEVPFELSGYGARKTAGLGDNLVGLHLVEPDADGERRVFGLGLDREISCDIAVAGVRHDLGKFEATGIVRQRRVEFLEKEAIAQGGFGDGDVSAEIVNGAEAGSKIDVLKGRDAFLFLVEKTETGLNNIRALKFGRK